MSEKTRQPYEPPPDEEKERMKRGLGKIKSLEEELGRERRDRAEAERLLKEKLKEKYTRITSGKTTISRRSFLKYVVAGAIGLAASRVDFSPISNLFGSLFSPSLPLPDVSLYLTGTLPIGGSILDIQGFEGYSYGVLGKSIYSDQVFSNSYIVNSPVHGGQKSLKIEKGDGFYRDYGPSPYNTGDKIKGDDSWVKKGLILEFYTYLDPAKPSDRVDSILQLYLRGSGTAEYYWTRYRVIIQLSSAEIGDFESWTNNPSLTGFIRHTRQPVRRWIKCSADLGQLIRNPIKYDLILAGYMCSIDKSNEDAGSVYFDDITIRKV